ncbi:hypothetical protein ZWY2020_022735 [Hordeum vulgare]|nr:hypothetical protein ZWY2020_022735 [Hordeum vulgare]
MLWDVSRIRSSTAAACWELLNASINISSLAWSPKPDVVGFTDGATAALLDLRMKEPLHSGARHTDRTCSCIRFSPHNEHQIAVSCGDEYCFPSLLVWDVRKMNHKTPLRQFCDHSGGVRHISWSRNEDLILVGTNNRLQIWDPTDAAMICEEPISRPCDGAEWINTTPRRFVASFNREMTMYQLHGDSKTVSREGGSVKHRGWMEQFASE